MQRHKSAEKEARKSVRHNNANREARSRLKSKIRHVVESKDTQTGAAALKAAYSALDKSVKTGLIHANNAANKKARLTKMINNLAKPTA